MKLKISQKNLLVLLIKLATVGSGCGSASAQSDSELPPNWKAGGKATEGYLHESNSRKNKKRKKNRNNDAPPPSEYQQDIDSGEKSGKKSDTKSDNKSDTAAEAEFQPAVSKSRRHTFSLFASTPELVRMDYRYSFSAHLALTIGASFPVPIAVEVAMPSDVIKADKTKSIAVAYPAFNINFKVDWGPHVHTGLIWHPFGGSWYNSFAAGVRSVRIKGKAASQLRVCSIAEAVKEPPCGNDAAAIQTRNSIALDADITLVSTVARVVTGWVYDVTPAWAINLELGAFAPLNTKQTSKITASIIAPDGTQEDVSGALSELRAKSEVDVADKAKTELGKITNRPIPVLGIGVGYRF